MKLFLQSLLNGDFAIATVVFPKTYAANIIFAYRICKSCYSRQGYLNFFIDVSFSNSDSLYFNDFLLSRCPRKARLLFLRLN